MEGVSLFRAGKIANGRLSWFVGTACGKSKECRHPLHPSRAIFIISDFRLARYLNFAAIISRGLFN